MQNSVCYRWWYQPWLLYPQGPSLVKTPPKGTKSSKLQAENFRTSLVSCSCWHRDHSKPPPRSPSLKKHCLYRPPVAKDWIHIWINPQEQWFPPVLSHGSLSSLFLSFSFLSLFLFPFLSLLFSFISERRVYFSSISSEPHNLLLTQGRKDWLEKSNKNLKVLSEQVQCFPNRFRFFLGQWNPITHEFKTGMGSECFLPYWAHCLVLEPQVLERLIQLAAHSDPHVQVYLFTGFI